MPLSGRRKRERKSNKLKKRRAGRNSCSAFAWGTKEYFRPRCGNGAPTTAREQGLCPMVSRQLRCPKVSKGRTESPLVRPLAHTPAPEGNDAPTTAREQGLQPYGAFTLFFRWRKKSVQKKASGTATPGKSPLLPNFERGSSQCRAQSSWRDNTCVCARSCSLFSSFKKGKAFSLRCLSPPSPPFLARGILTPCGLECYDVAWIFLQHKKPA